MNENNQVNQPVDVTSNTVGVQQPVMQPLQNQQPVYTPPAGYTQYQAPQPQYQPQGTYQQPQQGQPYQYRQPTPSVPGNGFCIASLVLGIISIFLVAIPWVNLILVVLAIVFGIIGLAKKRGDGKAIAGLVLGSLMVVPTIIIMIAYGVASSYSNYKSDRYFNLRNNTYNTYNTRYDWEDIFDDIFE